MFFLNEHMFDDKQITCVNTVNFNNERILRFAFHLKIIKKRTLRNAK